MKEQLYAPSYVECIPAMVALQSSHFTETKMKRNGSRLRYIFIGRTFDQGRKKISAIRNELKILQKNSKRKQKFAQRIQELQLQFQKEVMRHA